MKREIPKSCEACTGNSEPLDPETIEAWLKDVPKWGYNHAMEEISRQFKAPFGESVSFLVLVSILADRENHHPDVDLTVRGLTLSFTTHALGRQVSVNDFVMARQVDALWEGLHTLNGEVKTLFNEDQQKAHLLQLKALVTGGQDNDVGPSASHS
jgi:4a-hydroxytetrahydrobiopterin dehydratase